MLTSCKTIVDEAAGMATICSPDYTLAYLVAATAVLVFAAGCVVAWAFDRLLHRGDDE